MRRAILLLVFAALTSQLASAQTPVDSLHLPALRATALAQDPRAAELELLASQSALRLQNINADLRPALSFESQAQYQSDVATIPLTLPGVTLPQPSHDTYDAHLNATQRIYDPSSASRKAIERAQTANPRPAFEPPFTASRNQSTPRFSPRSVHNPRSRSFRPPSLTSRLSSQSLMLASGLALHCRARAMRFAPSCSGVDRLLRNKLRHAKRLSPFSSDLIGQPIDPSVPLSAPHFSTEVATARAAANLRARPEYEQFDKTRDVLARNTDALSSKLKPGIAAFGRLGYGRPGLNPLSNKFDSYWLTGVQLQWSPWNWGVTSRDRQVNLLQRDIIASEEKAFTAGLKRSVEQDLASIERLEASSHKTMRSSRSAKRCSPKPALVTPKRSSPPPNSRSTD